MIRLHLTFQESLYHQWCGGGAMSFATRNFTQPFTMLVCMSAHIWPRSITLYYPSRHESLFYTPSFAAHTRKNPIEKSLVFWQDSEQQNWLRPSNFVSVRRGYNTSKLHTWISISAADKGRALISRSASLGKVAARFPPLFFWNISIDGSWIMWRTFHITSNFPTDKSGWAF